MPIQHYFLVLELCQAKNGQPLHSKPGHHKVEDLDWNNSDHLHLNGNTFLALNIW